MNLAPTASGAGCLYIVGTPIGNLEDISARALRVLGEVDGILAEDTRHSAKLLRHFGINTPMSSWHAHNENERLERVLERLDAGEVLALISDAGMPLISDPGFGLVRGARDRGIQVECIPGPTALVTALVLSGLPAERFIFDGFLPAKSVARRAALATLHAETRTTIYYESPHRLAACLQDVVAELGGDRSVCVAKELTKRFELVKNGSAQDIADWAQQAGAEGRGEFVLLVAGVEHALDSQSLDAAQVMSVLSKELPARQAAKLTAKLCGGKANDYYRLALE